ncbi:FAD-dependent oxidoreductase [Sphingomonas oryzagri]
MSDPILIVGAGPTGLTAALELTRFGIPVRVVDKRGTPATTSRAIGIQARTLELMEQRGLAEEMVRLGNKGHFGSVYGGGERLFRLDFGKVASRYDYMLFLSQAETERILREALARRGIEPEWSVEMVGVARDALSPDTSPVSATLLHADGHLERAKAPWLVSAEGAHSLVRTTLDLQFEGDTLAEDYALGDLHLDGDLADSDFHIFSSEHGFMGLFPMGSRRFRLIASNPLSKPSRDTAPSEDELQRIYDQRSPIPVRIHDTSWTSWFRINSRMVPRLKIGRLLLGGDSAHIHSPAGAQGMNTGIQDMINLGWKLALVMQGKAPPALLDTYEQERLPVIRDVLFKTENLTEVIGAENPVARTLFNHLGPWIGGADVVQESSTNRMAQVAIGYRNSRLSENHAHGGALKAGDRVPEIVVRRRTEASWETARLLELLDASAFVLLVAHEDEGAALDERLEEAVAAAGVPLRIIELAATGEAAAYRRELGTSSVFLVRPDGYIAVASGSHDAARAIAAFVKRWFQPEREIA